MGIERLNFGTVGNNDGEPIRAAFPKLDANDAYLDGLVSGHETRIATLETQIATGVPDGTDGYALIGNGVGNATTFQGFEQGGTGATVRTWENKARERVTPYDYMSQALGLAVSFRSATAADAPAITAATQAAIDYCAANRLKLSIPAGLYLFDDKLTATVPIVLDGDGTYVSTLRWIATATDQGVSIAPTVTGTTKVSNLSLETLKVAVGTALTIDYSATISGGFIVPRANLHAHIDKVWIGGATDYVTDGWLNGAAFISCLGVTIDSSRFNGVYTGAYGSTPNSVNGLSFGGAGAPVQLIINGSFVSAWQVGLEIEDAEGVYGTNNEFVTVSKGIVVNNASGEPQLCLVGFHIAAIEKCIELTNCIQWFVDACLLYPIGAVVGDFLGIHVKTGCQDGIVSNTIFNNGSAGGTALYRGIVEDGGTNTKIENNSFRVGSASGSIAIDITSNAVNTDVGHNQYPSANVRIANASTSATFAEFRNYTGSLDDIVTSNRRHRQHHILGTGATGLPVGLGGSDLAQHVETFSYDANSGVQVLTPWTQNRRYQRRKSGGTWQTVWSEFDYQDPIFSSVTASRAGVAATFTNTTDNASVEVARFDGDRATFADNDEAYISHRLSNDAGTQTAFARTIWKAIDVNAGTSEDGAYYIDVLVAAVMTRVLSALGAGLRVNGGLGINEDPTTSGGLRLTRSTDNPFMQFSGAAPIAQLRGSDANDVLGIADNAGSSYFAGVKTTTGHFGVGAIGSGAGTPDARIHAEEDNATNNGVTEVIRATHTTSGTPGNGIGVRYGFEVECASANRLVAAIDAVTTDVTNGSEDADVVINAMAAGTLAEKARIRSTGEPVFRPPSSAAALGTNGEVTFELTSNTSLTFKARGSDGTTRSGSVTLS